MKGLIVIIILFVPLWVYTQESIPFTLEDRDRMIRMEEKLLALEDKIKEKFNNQEFKFAAQNDKLQTMLFFVMGGILGLVGFILWDRRTFLKPFDDKVNDVAKTNAKLLILCANRRKPILPWPKF